MLKITLFLIGVFSFFAVNAQQKFNCYFQLNSSVYSPDSIVKLKDWLRSFPASEIIALEIIAYTDTIGSMQYNDLLAKKRLGNISEIITNYDYTVSETKIIGKRYNTENYTNNSEFRKVEIQLTTKVVKTEVEVVKPKEAIVPSTKKTKATPKSKKNAPKNVLVDFESAEDNTVVNLNIEFQNNNDVYRDRNSANQVYQLAEYLKKYPQKKLIILGHVCCSDNKPMSVSRAKRVYKDLKSYNISKKRMTYKGMSNTAPLVKEISANAEQQNRRVEVLFFE